MQTVKLSLKEKPGMSRGKKRMEKTSNVTVICNNMDKPSRLFAKLNKLVIKEYCMILLVNYLKQSRV